MLEPGCRAGECLNRLRFPSSYNTKFLVGCCKKTFKRVLPLLQSLLSMEIVMLSLNLCRFGSSASKAHRPCGRLIFHTPIFPHSHKLLQTWIRWGRKKVGVMMGEPVNKGDAPTLTTPLPQPPPSTPLPKKAQPNQTHSTQSCPLRLLPLWLSN